MDRITKADLLSRFDYLKEAACAAGVQEASRWHLDIGSKTYGNAYRIWLAHPDYELAMLPSTDRDTLADGWSAHYTPAVPGYLGMTAREAYEAMGYMSRAFWAAVDANK